MQKRVTTNLFFEILYIVFAWKLTVDEQVGNFGKALLSRELFNRVTAIAKNSLVAINVGDCRSSRSGVGESVVKRV